MDAGDLVLGEKVRDTVSGWEGTATARYEYLNGCVRVEISGKDKDGKPEAFVFDVQQVEPVGKRRAKLAEGGVVPRPLRATGGPRSNKAVSRG